MLKQERQRHICQIVETQGQVTVADLSRQFGVTEMTIRRDLHELDARGLIQRIHGGALSPERRRSSIEPPVLERIKEQSKAKRHIAQVVAGMIKDGETIFLGSGTTTLAIAEALIERDNLTVVTNALTVASVLSGSPTITVVVVGGFLRHSELSLIGYLTEAAIRDLRVDKLVMGIRGIDPEYGLTSDNLEELRTDQAIMGISNMVIIVADHTKFGQVAASRLGPVTAATMIVTDAMAPADIVRQLRELGVEVLLVD